MNWLFRKGILTKQWSRGSGKTHSLFQLLVQTIPATNTRFLFVSQDYNNNRFNKREFMAMLHDMGYSSQCSINSTGIHFPMFHQTFDFSTVEDIINNRGMIRHTYTHCCVDIHDSSAFHRIDLLAFQHHLDHLCINKEDGVTYP